MDVATLDRIVEILKRDHLAFRSKHNYDEKLPYLRVSEAEFDKKVELLKRKLPKLTNRVDVKREMCALFACLGDAHTMFVYSRRQRMDIEFLHCKDAIYLKMVDSKYKDLLLHRVDEIEGYNIQTLLNKAKKIIPFETKEWFNHFSAVCLSDPHFLAMLGIDVKATLRVKLDNQEFNFPLKSESVAMPPALGHQSWYDVSTQEGITVIRYTKCRADLPNWEKFCKDVKNIAPSSAVIVDLRDNEGGNSRVFTENVAKVLKEKHCVGCALVNNGVFSSGGLAVKDLRKLGFKLIGENMAQPMDNYFPGETPQEDKFKFAYNVDEYSFTVTNALMNLRVKPTDTNKPDIKVANTIEALRAGHDLVLERAVEYLNKTQLRDR